MGSSLRSSEVRLPPPHGMLLVPMMNLAGRSLIVLGIDGEVKAQREMCMIYVSYSLSNTFGGITPTAGVASNMERMGKSDYLS
jgi:hypothetical protein